MELLIFAAILIVFVAFILIQGILIVRQSETMVIERWGRYHRTLSPGINLIIPFMDQARPIMMLSYRGSQPFISNEKRIDLREAVLDFPQQPVVTADNVSIGVNGVLYFQIIDPKRAVYETENLVLSVQTLAQTTLRSVLGKMELDEMLSNREKINAELQGIMDEAGDKWGVKVNRVEVKDIDIPSEIQSSMNQQMSAERDRRAAIARAEGEKRSEILKAEGDRDAAIARAQGEQQAAILAAEGQKQAAILHAEGEARAIENITSSLGANAKPQDAVRFLISMNYIETLPNIAKNGERVFLPIESAALVGSVGGIKELLNPSVVAAGTQQN
ncbi:stomatin [Alkalilimnicola ehrlichii]|uniref:Stomatin n=1 Tax=Alkalilimnicola ehrlichii TaxID=351052 RepID=A0A3E0WV82_9GAMM|nr:SPFH domain-containing protein [Alkalilimnicola ehrlichii]RFA29158.1 stomatin [Alkalilimnicola ehrlichii]RFA36071.1 stomatin [Alkalilimnicola ehrlichii]